MTQEKLFGQDGIIRNLTSRLLNRILEAEMDVHLGYKKHSNEGDNSGNSRNGYSKKKILTHDQNVELNFLRDRYSKRQKFSRVTDAVHDDVRAWRTRPLERTYPIVYLDALRVNSLQNGKNENKAIYLALGINMWTVKKML